MPVVIDMDYVDKRFAQFVDKYAQVLTAQGHPPEQIGSNVAMLRQRLATRDYHVRDANRPVCHLHAGKRVARFLIKTAIEFSPARKAQIARWREQYGRSCAEARRTQPHITFFSFEAAYAGKLRLQLAPHKAAFRL